MPSQPSEGSPMLKMATCSMLRPALRSSLIRVRQSSKDFCTRSTVAATPPPSDLPTCQSAQLITKVQGRASVFPDTVARGRHLSILARSSLMSVSVA